MEAEFQPQSIRPGAAKKEDGAYIYSVYWRASATPWATRLTTYLLHVPDTICLVGFFLIHYSRAGYTYGEAMGRALRA